ncbi:MAG: type I-B CRISPR-associated endonuclease Cas1b [Candidatus Kryptonium sp.]
MKKPLYIMKSGRLRRKENTIVFEFSDEKEENQRKVIPIESIDSIFVFGEVDMNSKVLNFLAKSGVSLHVFDYYGHYSGTFFPRESFISGYIIVRQVKFYLDSNLRVELAKEIINSAGHNILKNLKYYQSRTEVPEFQSGIELIISDIKSNLDKIGNCEKIEEIMGIEGQINKVYFEAWNFIIKANDEVFKFEKRERKPPTNPINALISFGNSLLYSVVLDEIYKTQLNPAVSFLHEPSTMRFSLSLDLSEIFKPLLVDRLIFSLINHRQIKPEHFDEDLNYTYLNDKGRKIFISEFDKKLETTIKHLKLKRSVSYRTLIRLECYKLIKHIMGEEKYEGFKIWW